MIQIMLRQTAPASVVPICLCLGSNLVRCCPSHDYLAGQPWATLCRPTLSAFVVLALVNVIHVTHYYWHYYWPDSHDASHCTLQPAACEVEEQMWAWHNSTIWRPQAAVQSPDGSDRTTVVGAADAPAMGSPSMIAPLTDKIDATGPRKGPRASNRANPSRMLLTRCESMMSGQRSRGCSAHAPACLIEAEKHGQ